MKKIRYEELPQDWQPSDEEVGVTAKAIQRVSAEYTGTEQDVSSESALDFLRADARVRMLRNGLGLTNDEANYCDMFMKEVMDDQGNVDMRRLAEYTKSFIFNEPGELPTSDIDPDFQDTMKSLYGKLQRFL